MGSTCGWPDDPILWVVTTLRRKDGSDQPPRILIDEWLQKKQILKDTTVAGFQPSSVTHTAFFEFDAGKNPII